MIEAAATAAVAAIAGVAALLQKLHNRVSELDSRMDRFELYSEKTFVNRVDHADQMKKIEAHMIRIEEKLDKFIQLLPRPQA
jgi:uncharacterized membrane protein YhiD involved in acid resistance